MQLTVWLTAQMDEIGSQLLLSRIWAKPQPRSMNADSTLNKEWKGADTRHRGLYGEPIKKGNSYTPQNNWIVPSALQSIYTYLLCSHPPQTDIPSFLAGNDFLFLQGGNEVTSCFNWCDSACILGLYNSAFITTVREATWIWLGEKQRSLIYVYDELLYCSGATGADVGESDHKILIPVYPLLYSFEMFICVLISRYMLVLLVLSCQLLEKNLKKGTGMNENIVKQWSDLLVANLKTSENEKCSFCHKRLDNEV